MTPAVLMPVVALPIRGESYLRGTSTCRNVVDWIGQISASNQEWSATNVSNFINDSIVEWLAPESGKGKGDIDVYFYTRCSIMFMADVFFIDDT